MSTLTANLEERIDTRTRERVQNQVVEGHGPSAQPSGRLSRFFEEMVAKRLGQRHLALLAFKRGRVTEVVRELPDRMHMLSKQMSLVIELVDDFRAGVYRQLPWHSLAVAAGALLYAASPADLLPDVLVGLGMLDDIAVAALAVRALRKDLIKYCEFKGYSKGDYFSLA